ncbi:MAG TPA: hypothetical protein VF661_14470 [Actinomycetales bacterium]
MSVLTLATSLPSELAPSPHPMLRATALSSALGLVAGLVVGLMTQSGARDRG